MITWTQQNTPANALRGLLVLTVKVRWPLSLQNRPSVRFSTNNILEYMGRTSISIALSSFVKIYCTRLHLDEILVSLFISKGSYVFLTTILIGSVLCFMFLYILRKLLMLAESREKCFWLSCNARKSKETLRLASVTYMTRDINDTFSDKSPGWLRKTLLCW